MFASMTPHDAASRTARDNTDASDVDARDELGRHVARPIGAARISRRLRGVAAVIFAYCFAALVSTVASDAVNSAPARTRVHYRDMLAQQGAVVLTGQGADLQRSFNDCGVAVLREALRASGATHLPPHDSLERLVPLSLRGTTLPALLVALEQLGARAIPFSRSGSRVPDAAFIAHMRYGHFVLVRSVRDTSVRFFDPLVGEVSLSVNAFEALWSGAALMVRPGPSWQQGDSANRRVIAVPPQNEVVIPDE
jgi:hypothetical protein